MNLPLGIATNGATVALPLRYANRHGLVTGATGTGKTVTLQRLAEQFSLAGVPVFAADVKGDLSGIAAAGDPDGAAAARAAELKTQFAPQKFPVALWDIFGKHGLPIHTSVHAVGAQLLANMLSLNETQAGTLEIAFRKAREENDFFLSLDDLRWALNSMIEMREEICQKYGNVTASSIAAIQRQLLALEAQGGAALFGEPPFNIADFMRVEDGKGVVNLLHADQLTEAPKLYATFLLWLLTELFRTLPEAGDLDKPKLVFFFDEAHLLFNDAPRALMQQIERLVRLVRSKGVGVYFVSQSPADIPDAVLAQLGNRIQHALRAYTPKDQRLIRAAAQAFRPNPAVNVHETITRLGIGEALVSVMESDGVPSPVERVKMLPPQGQIGPISQIERDVITDASPFASTYAKQFEPGEAAAQFVTRMREKVGLPPIDWSAEQWRSGDFEKFVPSFIPAPTKPRRKSRNGLKALIGIAIAVSAFAYAGVF